jgi:hypothetical protein
MDASQHAIRALIATIHGGPDEPELTFGPVDFDDGPRTDYMPRAEPRPLPPGEEPRELGWGHGVERSAADELFFPWLRGK